MSLKTVWKFDLETEDRQVIVMPTGAVPRKIMVQHGVPRLWAEVDSAKPVQPVCFDTFGTGHPIPDAKGLEYVDSYSLHNGGLVFHVYLNRTKTGA